MIPNIREAKYVQSMIDRLGVPDVQLIYDHQVKMWMVAQMRKKENKILIFDQAIANEPYILFWIKKNDGTYRVPQEQDINDIIAIVTRAQTWFEKGSDAMIDEIEKQEKIEYDKNRQKQSERIRSAAKPLKKLLKEM